MKYPLPNLLRGTAAPLRTLNEIRRRIELEFRLPPQVVRMRGIAEQAPLVLQIETTNRCNARCLFCAYPSMKRQKGVMAPELFAKIVRDYCDMGGGAVSLTPVVGDALLDPYLLERLKMLNARQEISQISLTTNAIALDRYSDEELRYILKTLDCVQVSIGGLDAETYLALYGVDQYSQVEQAMERLLAFKATVPDSSNITFAFRTNDWKFEKRFRQQLESYRRRGAFVSHICAYANYSGVVQNDKDLNLTVIAGRRKKDLPCIYPSVHMAVCWDGTITACGCADFNADALVIGNAGEETISQVWSGAKRTGIMNSFARGNLYEICRQCSAYQPDAEIFSAPYCKRIVPHRPLPMEYFRQFWGG